MNRSNRYVRIPISSFFFIVLVSWLGLGCVATESITRPEGEPVKLTLLNDDYPTYNVELVAVNDSSVICFYQQRFFEVPFLDIVSIYAKDQHLITKDVAMYHLMGFNAYVGLTYVQTVAMFVPGLMFASLAAGTPFAFKRSRVEFDPPLKPVEREMLRQLSRYPQGLKASQWSALLTAHRQADFAQFKRVRRRLQEQLRSRPAG